MELKDLETADENEVKNIIEQFQKKAKKIQEQLKEIQDNCTEKQWRNILSEATTLRAEVREILKKAEIAERRNRENEFLFYLTQYLYGVERYSSFRSNSSDIDKGLKYIRQYCRDFLLSSEGLFKE